jgi:hypothetical protein
MYQFNGWFEVSDDPFESDPSRLDVVSGRLEDVIEKLDWPNGFVTLKSLNGSLLMHLAGAGNRPRDYPDDLQKILHLLATESPGSYGAVFERDDERGTDPGPNEFRVTVLRRGVLSVVKDPFFSPLAPTIED